MPGPRGESFYIADLDGRPVFVGPATTMGAVFSDRLPPGTRFVRLSSEPYEVALVPVTRYGWREDGGLDIEVPDARPVRLIDRRPPPPPRRAAPARAVRVSREPSPLPRAVKVADAEGFPLPRRVGRPRPAQRISAVQREMIDYTKAHIREQRRLEARKAKGWLRRMLSLVFHG